MVYLRSVQGIPLARLSHVLRDLFGLEISEGALVNILSASRKPFAAQTSLIKARLMAGTALASDETGMRVGKANWWLWVFHHRDSAVFVADNHRSKAVVEAFLGDWRPDYWISDRYGGQMGWAKREHQVCLAHLIRDVQYAVDEGDAVFAPGLKGLLKRACAIGRRRDALADSTLKIYEADLNRRLDRLMSLIPTHKAGGKLQKIIKKVRRHLFVFVTNRDLTATNNGSERALRPCAVYRKITNGFRSQWAPRSTPISDPSSKPHGEDRSEPSTPSASPSKAAPSLAQLENANADLSNYRSWCPDTEVPIATICPNHRRLSLYREASMRHCNSLRDHSEISASARDQAIPFARNQFRGRRSTAHPVTWSSRRARERARP